MLLLSVLVVVCVLLLFCCVSVQCCFVVVLLFCYNKWSLLPALVDVAVLLLC